MWSDKEHKRPTGSLDWTHIPHIRTSQNELIIMITIQNSKSKNYSVHLGLPHRNLEMYIVSHTFIFLSPIRLALKL